MPATAPPDPGQGNPNRPRSLADTMEDLLLQQKPGEDAEGWAPLPEPEPDADDAAIDASQLGLTQAQPQTGALRPTLIVGGCSQSTRAPPSRSPLTW